MSERTRPASGDVIAGVTVALVLVPQAMAYAKLAGMPPERGLYAATIPLLVAAPLASSPYLQTGPVALTALMSFGALSSVAAPGSDRYVALGLLLALIVGIVRVLVGLLRAGVIAYLMSRPVLMGFVPGAATLIVCSQLPGVLDAGPPDGGLLEQAGWALVHPGAWRWEALALALGVGAALFGGRRAHPLFPGVLLGVVAATVISAQAGYDGAIVGDIPIGVPPLSLDLPWGDALSLLVPGVVIALVGFAEPASIARTFAARERRPWDADREFVSQGAANVAAGLTGGFPVGGSFSRSALNRQAGARTPWSGAVTGAAVLLALPLVGVLSALPTAVLAAVVIAAAAPLLDPMPAVRLWRHSRPQALTAATTFFLTLALAPRIERAILAGVALSLGVHLWRELRIDMRAWREETALHVRPQGVLWFGAAQALEDRLLRELARERDADRLVLHLDGVGRLDVTAGLSLRAALDEARRAGMAVEVVGVRPADRRIVDGVVLDRSTAADGG